MPRVLSSSFFRRSVLAVAPDLLGKFLVRRVGGKALSVMITEVEAYDGHADKACHASRGKTPRTTVMFGPAGRWYVYFVYGMHWMLNIVTGEKGYPAAVLVRGATAVVYPERSHGDRDRQWRSRRATADGRVGDFAGPAKLTKAFRIDGALNGKPASRTYGLWIEDRGVKVLPDQIRRTPRIGVAYAGIWARKHYRFVLSKPKERNT